MSSYQLHHSYQAFSYKQSTISNRHQILVSMFANEEYQIERIQGQVEQSQASTQSQPHLQIQVWFRRPCSFMDLKRWFKKYQFKWVLNFKSNNPKHFEYAVKPSSEDSIRIGKPIIIQCSDDYEYPILPLRRTKK